MPGGRFSRFPRYGAPFAAYKELWSMEVWYERYAVAEGAGRRFRYRSHRKTPGMVPVRAERTRHDRGRHGQKDRGQGVDDLATYMGYDSTYGPYPRFVGGFTGKNAVEVKNGELYLNGVRIVWLSDAGTGPRAGCPGRERRGGGDRHHRKVYRSHGERR